MKSIVKIIIGSTTSSLRKRGSSKTLKTLDSRLRKNDKTERDPAIPLDKLGTGKSRNDNKSKA